MTITTQDPAGIERAVLAPVPAVRAWVVLEGGRVEGSVVRYAERGQDGRFLYVVRNVWDQDLGVVDELGRAWRRVPHQEDRWIGTGTVADGVRRILRPGPRLRPVRNNPSRPSRWPREAPARGDPDVFPGLPAPAWPPARGCA